jgi:hypothetical protein
VGRRKWRKLEIRKAKEEDGNGKKCGLWNADCGMFPKAAVTHNVAGGEAGLSNAKQRLGLSNAETRGQPPTREAMASQGGRRAGIVERESDETTRPRTTGPRRPRRVIGKQNCRAGASPADPSNGKRERLPYKSVIYGPILIAHASGGASFSAVSIETKRPF